VFINGEYYGVRWLKSPRTENHLARRYGGSSEDYAIVEGGDQRLRPEWWFGEQYAVDDLREVFALARGGLTDDARFAEFCARIDLDSLVRYYSMQLYLNNQDWPNHNIEMYRYFGDDPSICSKWRFFSHDLEAGWAVWDSRDSMVREDTLRNVLTGGRISQYNATQSSTFLYYLLQREDMQAKFANTFVDLMEDVFSPENIIETLDTLIARIRNEHEYSLRTNFHPDTPWWPTIESNNDSREAIRRYARLRPQNIYASVRQNLGFLQDERFTVNLTVGEGGAALMHSRTVGENQSATGNYFAGTEVIITAMPFPGYVTAGESVIVLRGDTNRDTNISLTFVKCPDYAELSIGAVKATDNDWIEIRNNTSHVLSTKGMYLSDSNSNLHKWDVPSMIIQPGEAVLILGRSNREDSAHKRSRASFNVSFGERVRLVDRDGTVVSLAEVTLMSHEQVQRRGNDGKWRVFEL
jgi:hypothetical protein